MTPVNKTLLPTSASALPGREIPLVVINKHAVNGRVIQTPFPNNTEWFLIGMGCFWGAERRLWQTPGVYTTAVGYSAGVTPNPTYEEVCSGLTGHNEVVLVVYEPEIVSFETLLATFWESHNPTQGMAQGNDQGTQYRSGLYLSTQAQETIALTSRTQYQQALTKAGLQTITTEVCKASNFYYAETYHQQYLFKNPKGYCGLKGTGVHCL